MSWICRVILKVLGWRVHGTEFMSPLSQFVVIVAPHTSNWDFPLGLLVRKGYHLERIKYLGKSSLFRPPFGWIFTALGGMPIDRSKNNNLVQSYVALFQSNPDLSIVLAPEGTRKKVAHFKTGFYFIAKGAGVPIIKTKFDYKFKLVDFSEPFYPSSDELLDITNIEDYFRGISAKNQANAF
ncbi:MAG: 1-acyl-sn-glycerol-3-phosphate acyltransferase [Bacteroidota bacterium]|nr:1-acyl-sn-glycerol-3-phosphate acyltransferase [Bacteroidota bacterium]